MIAGLGTVGWGVGGIEAQAAVLGQPVYMLTPDVIGVNVTGELRAGVTSTDMVLHVTEMLRHAKVVGKFVEFFGDGIARLTVPDRATIANMAPEYGATVGFFPVDAQTLHYLRQTGRPAEAIAATEAYYKSQGLFGPGARGRNRLLGCIDAGPRRDRAERCRSQAAAGPHRARRSQAAVCKRC